MGSFYQSSLRRSIQEGIYRKPVIELTVGGTTYRGTIKQTRVLGKEFRWSMVHGCAPESLDVFDKSFADSLSRYKRDHKQSDLFLQIGIDRPILEPYTKLSDTQAADLEKNIGYIQRDFLSWYGLRPTIREHMPHATIIVPTQATFAQQKQLCSDSGKRMANKATKASLDFCRASTEQEWRAFWRMWYTMSYDKGFAVISEDHFVALMDMLTTTKTGYLFVAKKDDALVSGSVCVEHADQLIYLYGATDRSFGHIGAHYRLTLHIAVRANGAGLSLFDLFGVAPPHAGPDHGLAGVTRFKQSFGGKTTVYAGSYDLVCSSRGYQAFKLWRTMKK